MDVLFRHASRQVRLLKHQDLKNTHRVVRLYFCHGRSFKSFGQRLHKAICRLFTQARYNPNRLRSIQ